MMMKFLVCFLFVCFHYSHAGCPKATFEFNNDTKKVLYNFIDSSVGNIGSLETCPYTGRPYVYLPCYPNSSWGHEPYYSICFKPPDRKEPMTTTTVPVVINPYLHLPINEIAKLPINTSNEMVNVISYLNQDTVRFQSSSDVISAVDIIDRVSMMNQTIDEQIPSTFYSIVDKIFSSNSVQEAQKFNQTIVKLLTSLDQFAQNLKTTQYDQNFHEKNLIVSIVNMPNNRMKPIVGFAFDSTTNQTSTIETNENISNATTITLDSQALAQQNRLTFSIFNHQHRLFDEEHSRVITRVVSLTIDQPQLTKHLDGFVKINFYFDSDLQDNQTNLTCAYWHIYENMTAHWSTEGCRLIDRNERNVLCECDHLTHFAILMDIEQKPLPIIVERALSIITLAGLLLSSMGLCLTILTFILFKKLRRHFSQKSLLFLSMNLLIVNILFAIFGLYTFERLPCVIIAGLLHYFILASFSWMFIMAVIQYLLFVKVFPGSISNFTRKAAAFAQIVPLIPITVILIIDPYVYTKREDHVCWLSDLPFYLSFILPIAVYMLVNSILFSIVAHALLCGRTGQQLRSTQMAESQRLSRFLVTLSCFVVLGLTWALGLFAIGPMRIPLQILFCLFASLTGFFIFLLYIVTSKAKRTYWNNAFKSLGVFSVYPPSLSTSSALVTSKEFSTTSTNDQPARVPSRLVQFPSQPQHFIDAYMPSSPPPPPAPPLPLPPPFLIEGDDPLNCTTLGNHFYEPRHVWVPQMQQTTTSLDDYSLFYASNHDATKL